MSIEVTYSSDNKTFKWRPSMNELDAMNTVASKGLKDKVDVILGVTEFGKRTSIAKSQLFDAVVFLINELENNSEMIPYFFDLKAEIPRGSGNYTMGGTGISGMKIKGDAYVIWHGLNKCVLIKKWQDVDMKIHHGEPLDIRHLSYVKTDEDSFIGDIQIIKRKMSPVLLKNLNKLKIFLEGCAGDDIIKVLG